MITAAIFFGALFFCSYYVLKFEDEKKAREKDRIEYLITVRNLIDNPSEIEKIKIIYEDFLKRNKA